jgi:hypothetical protein
MAPVTVDGVQPLQTVNDLRGLPAVSARMLEELQLQRLSVLEQAQPTTATNEETVPEDTMATLIRTAKNTIIQTMPPNTRVVLPRIFLPNHTRDTNLGREENMVPHQTNINQKILLPSGL